jgi:hypothetical protein
MSTANAASVFSSIRCLVAVISPLAVAQKTKCLQLQPPGSRLALDGLGNGPSTDRRCRDSLTPCPPLPGRSPSLQSLGAACGTRWPWSSPPTNHTCGVEVTESSTNKQHTLSTDRRC